MRGAGHGQNVALGRAEIGAPILGTKNEPNRSRQPIVQQVKLKSDRPPAAGQTLADSVDPTDALLLNNGLLRREIMIAVGRDGIHLEGGPQNTRSTPAPGRQANLAGMTWLMSATFHRDEQRGQHRGPAPSLIPKRWRQPELECLGLDCLAGFCTILVQAGLTAISSAQISLRGAKEVARMTVSKSWPACRV